MNPFWRQISASGLSRQASRWAASALVLTACSCSTMQRPLAKNAIDPFLDDDAKAMVVSAPTAGVRLNLGGASFVAKSFKDLAALLVIIHCAGVISKFFVPATRIHEDERFEDEVARAGERADDEIRESHSPLDVERGPAGNRYRSGPGKNPVVMRMARLVYQGANLDRGLALK